MMDVTDAREQIRAKGAVCCLVLDHRDWPPRGYTYLAWWGDDPQLALCCGVVQHWQERFGEDFAAFR